MVSPSILAMPVVQFAERRLKPPISELIDVLK
jgi:hypothetical protein